MGYPAPDPLLADTAADVVQLAIWSLLQRHGPSYLPLASYCTPDSENPDYIKVCTRSGHNVYLCFQTDSDLTNPGVVDPHPTRAPRHRAPDRY